MNYRPEIDGLRAVAVIPVIFFHAGYALFAGGFIGVDIFFVISGFLITNIIINELDAKNFSLLSFYERRARRILPALIVVMLACIPFTFFWFLPGDLKNFSESLVSTSLFFSNFLFWKESGYFEIASELKPLLHTWSLALEEQFYILFPIFMILMWKSSKNLIYVTLIFIFAISFSLSHWGAYNYSTAAFFLLPTRGWELLLGVFASFYLHKRAFKPNIYLAQSMSIFGMSLIIFSLFYFDLNTPFPSAYTLIPTIGALLIILFGISGTFINKLLSSKFLVGLGLISYSLYLIHQPFFAILKYRFQAEVVEGYVLPILFFITFLAYVNWKFIETPFRDRSKFSRSTILSLSLISMFVISAIGTIGVFSNGFEQRFSKNDLVILNQYTDANKYVNSRFDNYEINFDTNPQTKNIMIIGDSFGEDLINAIFEANLNRNASISTKKIQAHCGNLYIEKDITQFIRAQDLQSCKNGYDDKLFRIRLNHADEVWLASSWREWVIPMLSESIANIKNIAPKAKIKVFGRKHFGKRHINEFINSSYFNTEALLSTKPLPSSHIAINKKMKELISKDEFIDVSWIICMSEFECSNKTPEGLPISYDGVHFTKAGATYFGKLLKEKINTESLIGDL